LIFHFCLRCTKCSEYSDRSSYPNNKRAAFILGLSGLASATNIIAYTAEGCKNAYLGCDSIGPEACCVVLSDGGKTGAVSAEWQDLPGPSYLYGFQRTRDGNPCGSDLTSNYKNGGSACVTENPDIGEFSGLTYQSASAALQDRRRGVPQPLPCKTKVAPNRLGLADGTEFDLSRMTPEMVSSLWILAAGGATKDQIPQTYTHHVQ